MDQPMCIDPPKSAIQAHAKPIMKTIYVAQNKAKCFGMIPMDCFLVKMKPNDKWRFSYNNIEKFHYKEGFQYTLMIKETEIANPPADHSSVQWVLHRILSKKKSKNIKAVVGGN
ncbi:unnamed protein product [Didymodactylos carnosus]|uniref:DUF4377 domain-containing protein n=1 Tax=Didymodactylos carnosus TaxID=1234261 RepID=A0A814PIX0_9BILA|nr:unnamed protein product [Didymodactylos carnosus]CAF1197034.1 unnamed protein product [Didymodactylos carnosus]CAF3870991.1 unnamed protein product [Didymodactylos carnosus]CAF4007297.1 unnamed protein product [Didymodactylos carnosus]